MISSMRLDSGEVGDRRADAMAAGSLLRYNGLKFIHYEIHADKYLLITKKSRNARFTTSFVLDSLKLRTQPRDVALG